ncbi:MAG: S24 family peptidase [bacterium]|nr:S24 family peptidase [bacterium]
MPKVKYSAFVDDLQKLINYIPSVTELAKIIGITQNALSSRKSSNGYFSEKEQNLILTFYKKNKSLDDDCLSIPVRGDVTASMGYGITVFDESQTGTYQISRKLASDLGIMPERTEMIFASGDSMLPTIEGGDSLLVDLNRKEVYDGRIYCVRIEGQLYAKRLQKIPPTKIIVISDNQKYQSFEIDFSKQIDFDFEIIGEVRWWGRVAR